MRITSPIVPVICCPDVRLLLGVVFTGAWLIGHPNRGTHEDVAHAGPRAGAQVELGCVAMVQ
jgi:hypothetical protein